MTYATTRTYPDNPLLGPLSRADFISANMPLVHYVAKRYREPCRSMCVDYEDIVSEGNIGLINAYDHYSTVQFTFSTFAHSHIHGRIRNYFRDKAGSVRIPGRKLVIARKLLAEGLADAPPEVIADALDISVDVASEAAVLARIRFAAPLDKIDNEASIFAQVDDVSRVGVVDFIASIPDRQRQIANLLMEDKTQREIAEILNISQGRVTQLVARLRKDCAAEFEIAA